MSPMKGHRRPALCLENHHSLSVKSKLCTFEYDKIRSRNDDVGASQILSISLCTPVLACSVNMDVVTWHSRKPVLRPTFPHPAIA